MTPIIELQNVYRSFEKDRETIPVLKDVNLSIGAGEILCLVGESGCGKTTTGKIITGLLDPSSGSVVYEGHDVEKLPRKQQKDYRKAVQIIHQDPFASLNPAHTIGQILSFPLKRHNLVNSRAELRRRIWELLTLVDLTPPGDVVNKFPHQLSGGQRQRVSIARSLSIEPRVIVADEAVSMVDVSIRVSLLKTMLKLREDFGIAIVFITHDLAVARYFAWEGQIAVMYLGRIVEIGRTPDVIGNAQHPYTKALLAAIPEADPDLTRQKKPLELRGEDIPSLTNIPPGCSFHPRCPYFVPGTCDTDIPQALPIPGAKQDAACIPRQRGEDLQLYRETQS